METIKNEIWNPVLGYEGLYEVSSYGRVKSTQRVIDSLKCGHQTINERILKSYTNGNGYLCVRISKNGTPKTHKIHKLVAMAFLNHVPCGYKLVINHKNFTKTDNRLENLEIITQRENCNKKHFSHSSIFTGVTWNNKQKKWRAQIEINSILNHLGSFDNELAASEAYKNALNKIKYEQVN